MLCSECNKRPANFHYTQIVNGEKMEVIVCDVCAQNKNYLSNQSEEAFPLHELLTSLFKATGKSGQPDLKKNNFFEQFSDLTCKECHMTFTEFQRLGKFGCANCYEAFKPRLNSVLRRVHSGNTQHHGKIPKRKGGKLHIKKELMKYRDYLTQLIEEENFEEAAIVRDRIKQLESDKEGEQS